MLSLFLATSLGCAAPQPPAPEPAPATSREETAVPAIDERIDVELPLDKPLPVGTTGIEVTLLSWKNRHYLRDDGTRAERTSGVLRLKRGDETTEVPFDSGAGFEAMGFSMAVWGMHGNLMLSVYPPGQPVRP